MGLCVFFLVKEADLQEYSVIVDLLGNVGAMAFVFMLVWRTTNHTIPRLAKSFEDATKTARQDFRDELQQQRSDFRDILREHRDFITVITKGN